MSQPNKIPSKGKQSSIITASMSLCVSPETLEKFQKAIEAYDNFEMNKSKENYDKLEIELLVVMFEASKLRNEETIRQKERLMSQKKGTIDDVINSFFPTGE